MPEAQRIEFWLSLDNTEGKDMVYKALERLDQFEEHAEKYHDNLQAKLLPLVSLWYLMYVSCVGGCAWRPGPKPVLAASQSGPLRW